MHDNLHFSRNPGGRLAVLGLTLLLCACVTSPQGRPKIAPPAPISDVYSEADMRLHLATIPSIRKPCAEEECELNHAFDQQVQHLGAQVATAAYDAHPDLIKRVKRFEYEVVEKKEPGVTSNASGKIIVLRGTQQIGLNEQALAFVIAREMGHVISQHHEENATTRILLSVAAGVLFPALNLFGNTATIAQATSASTVTSTTVATTAASTATSYLGAKLVMNSLKPEQLSEADQVALDLLGRMGLSHRDLALALEHSAEFEPSNAWSEDFRYSIAQVRALETASDTGEVLPEIPSFDSDLARDESGDAKMSEVGLRDAEGNPLPPLEDPSETIAEVPAELIAVAGTAATPIQMTALQPNATPQLPQINETKTAPPAGAVANPVRGKARTQAGAAASRLKAAASSKKVRAGRGAKSKSARSPAPGKKPAVVKKRSAKKPVKTVRSNKNPPARGKLRTSH